MDKSDSIKNIAIAMCKAQAEMGGAVKGKSNPFFKSKYADLGAVIQAIKEPFANNGLSYIQFPIEDGGRVGIETILMHASGEFISNSFTVNLTKQDAQGAGSAITYCRRYGLQSIAGIPSEDDDGNNASRLKVKNNWRAGSDPKFLPAKLRDVFYLIFEAYEVEDLQTVCEKFSEFGLIEERNAIWKCFASDERSAITKFTNSDEYTINTDIQKVDYLAGDELDSFLERFAN